jgi:CubicO group peptidase (beta-lactamase class C family)
MVNMPKINANRLRSFIFNGAGTAKLILFSLRISPMVLALLGSTNTYAQDKTSQVDKIFSWATPTDPGCVCAVSQNGNVVLKRAYGSANLEQNVPLTPGSIFDIGSVRKQFIAAAVLFLVQEKRISLSDDIHKYFPELPNYGHTITVDHLLTHTSGLRDWTGLQPLAGGNTNVLTLILRQRGLNFTPGEEWAYSNSGYVLLAELVSRVSAMPFAAFACKRLFEPLGMKSSSYVADILQGTGDRAFAYQKEGSAWKPYMRLGNERGGGAVISTSEDLLIWNDALTNGRLGAFVTGKLQEPAKLNNGRKLTYARGLNVNDYPGARLVSHSGGAKGYSAWLGRFPEHGLSIAVLCNFDPVSATDLAHRVAKQFLPPDTAAAKAQASDGKDTVAGMDLSQMAGLFLSSGTHEPLRLTVNNNRLSIAEGPDLVPVSTNRFRNLHGNLFFMSGDEFELHFASPDAFDLKSMEGKTTRYRRTQPYAPALVELEAFTGRYQSVELESIFLVAPKGNSLLVRLEHAPDKSLEFKPVEKDIFQFRRMLVRFIRNAAGKVTAFEYSNPVARNIKFTRMNDQDKKEK